jgi:hypothetical protein
MLKIVMSVSVLCLVACSAKSNSPTTSTGTSSTTTGSVTSTSTSSLISDGGSGTTTGTTTGGFTTSSTGTSGSTGTVAPQIVTIDADCDKTVQRAYPTAAPDGGLYDALGGDAEYVSDIAIAGFDPRASPPISVTVCDSTCVPVSAPSTIIDQDNCQPDPSLVCAHQRSTTTACDLIDGGYVPPNLQCHNAEHYSMDTGRIIVSCGRGADHFSHATVRFIK